MELFCAILLPFLGTTLGSGLVFFMRKDMNKCLKRCFYGFSAGVMLGASVWGLLIPAIEMAPGGGQRFVIVPLGLFLGFMFVFCVDRLIEKNCNQKLFLAVTFHNIPEGIAIGVMCAGYFATPNEVSGVQVIGLAMAIAIQNIPEGLIVSFPEYMKGKRKGISFLLGACSGIVEPLGAMITVVAEQLVSPFLPLFLGVAAGAMIQVAIEELIPELGKGVNRRDGYVCFFLGFILMMILDMIEL